MATYVGIELDAHSLRAAIVRSQFGRTQLVRYVELWLANYAVEPPADGEQGAASPSSPLKLAVADLVKHAGAGAEIIAGISSDEVSLRRIELPAAAARKVEELLPFEMESVIPFETDTTILEHQSLDSSDPSKLKLLVCAAPKERIRARLEELAAIGVDPLALVPTAPSLAGLATFLPPLANADAPHLIVSILADRTELCVVRRGRAELARTISVGHRQVDEIGYAEASVGTEAERLARELRQTVTSYRLQGGGEPEVTSVAGLIDPSGMIVRWLAHALGRNVELLALPDILSPSGKTPTAPLDPVAKARFAGPLALTGHVLAKQKNIDLRKGEFIRARQLGFVRDLGPLLAVAAAAVFVAWGFSVYAQYSVLRARREVLESELARVSRVQLGQETRSVTEARELLEQGRTNPDPMPQWTALDALLAVSAAIPSTVTHDVQRMQVDLAQDRSEGHFELQGVVGTIEESDRIRALLAQIPCLQNLEQAGATTPAADGRRQYRLEADVRCPDEHRASDDSRRGRSRATKQGGS